MSSYSRVFDDEQEKALCEYIIDMENRLIGLTAKELRKLAFDFAKELKIPHKFNKDTGLAGIDWLSSFMQRHDLSNRKAEPTSAARANGFNKSEVDHFFLPSQDLSRCLILLETEFGMLMKQESLLFQKAFQE